MQRRHFLYQLPVLMSMGSTFNPALAVSDKAVMRMEGTDSYGKHLSLNQFAGKTILVSFFTIDCEVCSQDLKLMREFYAGNSNKNFVLLGVNLDQDKKQLDEYNEITTQAYPKNQRFPTVWRMAANHQDNFGNISRTPTHFVLNARQELVLRREGAFQPKDWDNLWEMLG